MAFCPPCRYDSPHALGDVRVDHRDFEASDKPDGVHATFSVLKSIVDLLQCGAVENLDCILKRDSVARDVARVFPRIPRKLHRAVFTLCIGVKPTRKPAGEWKKGFAQAREDFASHRTEAAYSIRSMTEQKRRTCQGAVPDNLLEGAALTAALVSAFASGRARFDRADLS
jgi:hypothetical protein